MNYITSIIFIIAGFTCLVKGADLFVDNASGIGTKLKVSALVIGLTVVAFGTSMPELAVSVTAALEGHNEIAVGNVVGSNIFNILAVAGMSACLYPLVINKTIMKRDWPFSTVASLLLAVFLIPDLHISRLEGVILLVLFAGTLFLQLKSGKEEGLEETHEENRPMWKLILFLIIGIALIIVGAELSVNGATELARLLGVSETLIGLTIVAIGTSLPELVTSVVAAKKGQTEIAMGNVIGSNLFNLLCILGVSAVLHPITVEATAIFDALFLAAISLVFWLLCKWKPMDRKMGLMMVLSYIGYTIYIIMR